MIIRNAEIWKGPRCDIRIEGSRVVELGRLAARASETVIDANGAALLPGLNDHHIHLAATAAAMNSVQCGPPDVVSAEDLASALSANGAGWIRGTAYHPCVAGMLTRKQIDRWQTERPVRIQHRSGRMWFFNSAAVKVLSRSGQFPSNFDPEKGQLFDNDDWLRETLGNSPPDLHSLSQLLASFGITGITEISPSNGPVEAEWLATQFECGHLLQRCHLAGSEALSQAPLGQGITLGPVKIHLHEHVLPNPELVETRISLAHSLGRQVAFHCTTETELVFALAVIEAAGSVPGDRIEHAGIAYDYHVDWMATLGVHVVSQPSFIRERGDRYLLDVDLCDQPWLYRLQAFRRAGVTLAAGSDAPYGSFDPWSAMRAAISRTTAAGTPLGPEEALSPEQAVELFLSDPLHLERQRKIDVGSEADLCLLQLPWQKARKRLVAEDVRCTFVRGQLVHNSVNQSPIERRARAYSAA